MPSSGYVRLHESPDGSGSREQALRNNAIDRWLPVAFCITACSLVLSLSLLIVRSPATPPSPRVLRRPNAYIGLEKLDWPSPTAFEPFKNFPRAIYQIKIGDATRKLTEDDRQWLSEVGTVVPEDLHFVATPTQSSVVQFRAMDWGMERCMLNINLPPRNSTNGGAADGSVLDIWKLGSDKELLPHIGGKNAPRRMELMTSREVRAGMPAGSIEFPCASGSFPMFEFTCSSPSSPCSVDFWQERTRSPEEGVYIVQHQSIGVSDPRQEPESL